MKTTSFLLAALLTLNISLLFAGNESTLTTPVPETNIMTIRAISPVAPSVATFEDAPQMPDVESFAPVAPSEADFSDSVQPNIDLQVLAPSIPVVADFE